MVCFLYKKLVFSPSGTCQHGVFSIYAIIAQLDRALASDNCGTLGSRQEIARQNVKKQAHHPVVHGRLTTN